MAIASALAGCGVCQKKATPAYPVYWGPIDPSEQGFFVVPLNEYSFSRDEVHVTNDEEFPEVRVGLFNRTGEDVFVAFGAERLSRYVTYNATTHFDDGREPVSHWVGVEGWSDVHQYYRLLESADLMFADPSFPFPRHPASSGILLVLPAPVHLPGAAYCDLTFEWPLRYYTRGASESACVEVTRRMRIVYKPCQSGKEHAAKEANGVR